ncbi:MAG: UDP-N-acetylmuramate dehydrogenase [Chloroflexi bacterium SZAS-1]|jgi:UDP-N-acetylmuramate dehydrogenase|nr:UDP-N-acetylmuramate dehydrogenase [Chloroflexi bacterium SZAS-1]
MSVTIIENEPLAKYTSWRIGGPARWFANATTADELREALAWAHVHAVPVFVLGGGTNLLVRDAGFAGLVLRYRDTSLQLRPQGERATAHIGAGAPMAGTVRRLAAQGWAGLEWAEGLPGTIGGAVFGNAGCYGGDIAGVLQRAWLLASNEIEEWPTERFVFGYRTSVLKAAQTQPAPIVLAAEFALQRADRQALAEQMDRTAAERKSKTPWGSSCGSVFKNPPSTSAGRLIEAAGLKGARIGQAEIAQKHANYIVNLGGASSDDILALIELARERVQREFGIELVLEVQIL